MTAESQIRDWWAANPMTYGDAHGETSYAGEGVDLGSPEFFARVDEEFFTWNRPLHDDRPFGRLFPYERYAGGNVLEVGCGMGTMASTWARQGSSVTAVDLNPVAVRMTKRRFALASLPGSMAMADARRLPFPTGAFDYAWSWGVLHHSPDLASSVDELLRVVRRGGEFGIMVYNRRSLLHGYMTRYVEGFLHRESAFLGPVELASRYGDAGREEGNPHTWPVTKAELMAMLSPWSDDVRVRVLGTDVDWVLHHLVPVVGERLPRSFRKAWARRLGWSLWASGRRR